MCNPILNANNECKHVASVAERVKEENLNLFCVPSSFQVGDCYAQNVNQCFFLSLDYFFLFSEVMGPNSV